MIPDWLKFKKYPHIGKPLTIKDTRFVISYVTNEKNIAKHKFLPLLHNVIYQRKYRPNKGAPKNKDGKRIRTIQNPKERPIFYASHLDSIIYGYYRHIITEAYEKFLSDKDFSNCAVAYRKIPVKEGGDVNKSNIEFAFDAFKKLKTREGKKHSIIISDISSFFDNLDHRILHSNWKKILNDCDSLPDDHYNIYKSLIVKRYVNDYDLFKAFQKNLIVERGIDGDDTKTKFKNKTVKHFKNLKRENVVAFCTKSDFFKEAKHLIRKEKSCSIQHKMCRNNCEVKGIPQGTPISAMLANVYMIDFDKEIHNTAKEKKAYYQRYSDDIILICNQEDESYFYELLRNSVEKLVNLEIQPEKTKIYRYEKQNDYLYGGIVDGDKVSNNNHIEYLGFVFDGKRVRVKSAGFSKFYREMKRSFRRGAYFASKPENKHHSLFEQRLYKRFSYRGAKRRLIYKPIPSNKKKFKVTKQKYWGNYISYLEKANQIMKPLNDGEDTIKSQYSRFWSNFMKEMNNAYTKIGDNLLKRSSD